MGNLHAQEFAEAVANGDTNLEAALVFHFRSNHYPPLPLSLIPLAVEIIKGEVAQEGYVELPNGITWKGKTSAPVTECIQSWHLDAFLLNEDDLEE